MDASTLTVGEFLGVLFPGRDVAAGLKRVQAFAEVLIDRIPAVIERVIVPICEMLERLEKLPPSRGYEPMLIERGQDPLVARFLSYALIRLGKDAANEAEMQRPVVDALLLQAVLGGDTSVDRAAEARLAAFGLHGRHVTTVSFDMSDGDLAG